MWKMFTFLKSFTLAHTVSFTFSFTLILFLLSRLDLSLPACLCFCLYLSPSHSHFRSPEHAGWHPYSSRSLSKWNELTFTYFTAAYNRYHLMFSDGFLSPTAWIVTKLAHSEFVLIKYYICPSRTRRYFSASYRWLPIHIINVHESALKWALARPHIRSVDKWQCSAIHIGNSVLSRWQLRCHTIFQVY